jgi:hypothetical protein
MSSSVTPKYHIGDRVQKDGRECVIVGRYLDANNEKWVYRLRDKSTSKIDIKYQSQLEQ